MKSRNIAAVILLPFVTLGIYVIYWFVSTKGELNARGANIPTSWLLIVPIANIYWVWKYFEGAEQVTNGKVNGAVMFIIDILVTALVPMAICQSEYNKLASEPATAAMPAQPTQPAQPSEPTAPPQQPVA